jgi:hypothetical protein
MIALILATFYPLLIYNSSQISAVTIYVFLCQLTIFLLFLLEKSSSKIIRPILSFFSGITMGLLVLARAETLLFSLIVIGWLVWRFIRDNKSIIFAFSLGIIIIISPWVIRNLYSFGRLTPLTISGGYNLWQGQNEHATGTLGDYVVPEVHPSNDLNQKLKAIPITNEYEINYDQLFMDDALISIKERPLNSIVLGLRKFCYYWFGIYFGFEMDYPGIHSPVILLPWFVLLPFSIIGLVKSFHDYKKYLVLYFLLASSTLIIMVFFVLPRYVIFIIPTAIMFAAHGLTQTLIYPWIMKKIYILKD